MEPVFVDLHIHTSNDPNELDPNYPIEVLVSSIEEFTNNSEFLISLTDHNTVNEDVYLKAKELGINILLGVELHIKNYDECPAYHCHIYFSCEISKENIDIINASLDKLYPNKVVQKSSSDIPKIQDIINVFDEFDFLLLPHGGQSHCTFDKSIPEGVRFDNTIERSIYYNQFDGFTARGDKGLERTQEYFKRLGINEFVNLLTCTDNYNPRDYPNAKSSEANPFVPTWMFAKPTFDGLRLSLSERSRLTYSNNKPDTWSEHIKGASLSNGKCDIDVELTSGLNVVIGDSSSGKTLFVDSISRKISNDFEGSNYESYEVNKLKVENPSGITPHYLSQNYIMSVVNENTDDSLDHIEMIKDVFPGDSLIREQADNGLKELKDDLKKLIDCVKSIEEQSKKLSRIPFISSLVTSKEVKENIIDSLLPEKKVTRLFDYSQNDYDEDRRFLEGIDDFLENNPLISHDSEAIKTILSELAEAFDKSRTEQEIRKVISSGKKSYDKDLKLADSEDQSKRQHILKLNELISDYAKSYITFNKVLAKISEYSTKCESEEIESMGHKLYIENDLEIDKSKFLDVVNHFLKSHRKIETFDSLSPENLFEENFKKQSPKVKDYLDFERKIYSKFEELNRKNYRIETADGRDFNNLSAGWKTSIILDLILGYEEDIAPIIIDQPEDNLATSYINNGLVNAIKRIKSKKQVILVSHNATIPMLADAQNVVLCRNLDGVIHIRSNSLEEEIDGTSVLDHVATITDGGKASVKKRVKKYNLKKFKE